VGYSVWVFFNFDWAPATAAFWLLAGALWSSVSLSPPGERAGVRGDKEVWRPAAAASLVVAAVVFAVLPPLADTWYLQGRADLAVRADPLQAQYHWALGTLPELQKAADLGETDPGLYVQLGDAYLREGDGVNARRAYERALEIDPYYTPAREHLSVLG